MNRFLFIAPLLAALLLASGPASAQRLNVNPYGALGFAVPADPDLCKVGTSGVDADARDTVRDISQGTELELNNCHLHAVDDSFSVSSSTASPCHPDHEPPAGDCGRPLSEWCDNPCTTNACGQSGCLRAQCPVIETTYEVLAPSWSYTFPLDAANSHELVVDATRQRKDLRGNCTCTTYSTDACPTVTITYTDPDTGQEVTESATVSSPDATGQVTVSTRSGLSFSMDGAGTNTEINVSTLDGRTVAIEVAVGERTGNDNNNDNDNSVDYNGDSFDTTDDGSDDPTVD